jgi:hypothetical protein
LEKFKMVLGGIGAGAGLEGEIEQLFGLDTLVLDGI